MEISWSAGPISLDLCDMPGRKAQYSKNLSPRGKLGSQEKWREQGSSTSLEGIPTMTWKSPARPPPLKTLTIFCNSKLGTKPNTYIDLWEMFQNQTFIALNLAVKVLWLLFAYIALSLSNYFPYYGSRCMIPLMDPLAAISPPWPHQNSLIVPKFMVTCHPDRIRKLGS